MHTNYINYAYIWITGILAMYVGTYIVNAHTHHSVGEFVKVLH